MDRATIKLSINNSIGTRSLAVRESKSDHNVYHPITDDSIQSIKITDDKVKIYEDNEVKTGTMEHFRVWSDKYEIQIYGRSDDLIVLDGFVSDEYTLPTDDVCRLYIGANEITVRYTGEWEFNVEHTPYSTYTEIYETDDLITEYYCNYSQLLCLSSPFEKIEDVKIKSN